MIEPRTRGSRIVDAAVFGIALGLSLRPTVALAAKTKLAVIPTQFDKTARGMVPALFDDYLLTAVQNISGDYQVIGQDDIAAMLGFEEQRDMLDCSDMSCMADIGGALGVDKLVSIKIARLGEDWVATAKIINIKQTLVENRVNQMIEGDVKALLQAVPVIIGKLFGKAGMSGGSALASAPTPKEPEPEKEPQPEAKKTAAAPPATALKVTTKKSGGLSLVVPVLVTIAGLAAVAGGVVNGVMASAAEACANSDIENPCPGGQRSAQEAYNSATIANVMYVAGGAVTAVGIVLFFFTGGSDKEATALLPAVGPDSVGLALSGRF